MDPFKSKELQCAKAMIQQPLVRNGSIHDRGASWHKAWHVSALRKKETGWNRQQVSQIHFDKIRLYISGLWALGLRMRCITLYHVVSISARILHLQHRFECRWSGIEWVYDKVNRREDVPICVPRCSELPQPESFGLWIQDEPVQLSREAKSWPHRPDDCQLSCGMNLNARCDIVVAWW